MTVRPIPDGFHTATPHLVVKDVSRAIEFYKEAFGATELMRLTDPSGIVAHAEIEIGDSRIMMAEEVPDWGNYGPESLGGSPVRIHLYVEDVDALANQAVAAGAKVLIPVDDQFYGDRAGRLSDPFGHIWIIATHKEDMSLDQMRERFEEFVKQQGGA
jgi:PhnB protein